MLFNDIHQSWCRNRKNIVKTLNYLLTCFSFFFSVEFFDKYCLYTQEQLAWYQAIFDDVSIIIIHHKPGVTKIAGPNNVEGQELMLFRADVNLIGLCLLTLYLTF